MWETERSCFPLMPRYHFDVANFYHFERQLLLSEALEFLIKESSFIKLQSEESLQLYLPVLSALLSSDGEACFICRFSVHFYVFFWLCVIYCGPTLGSETHENQCFRLIDQNLRSAIYLPLLLPPLFVVPKLFNIPVRRKSLFFHLPTMTDCFQNIVDIFYSTPLATSLFCGHSPYKNIRILSGHVPYILNGIIMDFWRTGYFFITTCFVFNYTSTLVLFSIVKYVENGTCSFLHVQFSTFFTMKNRTD